jgi:hypothetical protein
VGHGEDRMKREGRVGTASGFCHGNYLGFIFTDTALLNISRRNGLEKSAYHFH